MSRPITAGPAGEAPTGTPGAASKLAGPKDTPSTLREAFSVFWSYPSPRVFGGATAAVVALRLGLGEFSAVDVLIACLIVALWPLQEWLIHVLLLHFKPRTIGGRTIDLRNARAHRAHHRDPWQLRLVFVPLPSLMTGLPVLVGLAWALLPPLQAGTALAVYLSMALHYEWVHYLCHVRYRPTSKHYRALTDSHRWHHFKNENRWMGVTLLMGDRLLNTGGDPKGVERSKTVKTLGVEPAPLAPTTPGP